MGVIFIVCNFTFQKIVSTKGKFIMSKIVKFALLAMFCVTALSASGASWFARGNKYNIETLVITANYKSPRLIAELIQAESRQPYIIIPSANAKSSNWYLALPKTDGLVISEDKFGAWVKFSQCRRVVILGDTTYVPEKYESMIDKSIPVVRITGDWQRVAEELTFLLNLSNLKRNYPELRPQLDRYYQPSAAPVSAEKEIKSETEQPLPPAAADQKKK